MFKEFCAHLSVSYQISLSIHLGWLVYRSARSSVIDHLSTTVEADALGKSLDRSGNASVTQGSAADGLAAELGDNGHLNHQPVFALLSGRKVVSCLFWACRCVRLVGEGG